MCFGFPVLSFRSWSHYIYVVLFRSVFTHIRGGHDTCTLLLFPFNLFVSVSFSFSLSTHLDCHHSYVVPVASSKMAGHCIVCSVCCITMYFEVVSLSWFVPLVESGICLLVDVATLSTIYDVRHPLLLQVFRLFRYAYPSSSLRCSRKRPSLLSLACASGRPCASGRLSFAVVSRVCLRRSVLRCWRALLLCVLPFCNLFPRTYIRRRLIPYYDSGPLHKHQIYIRPIFHFCDHF